MQARRQDLALPRAGGGLEALQLLDDAREPVGADQLGVAGDALPAQHEPHQRRRAHRLDLLAQPGEREAMDAREHAAIAPLERRERARSSAAASASRAVVAPRYRRRRRRERAAQDRAVGLEREQRGEHVARLGRPSSPASARALTGPR